MSGEIKKISLDIWLNEKETYVNLFQKSYENNLHENFINGKEDKKQNINSHTKWFNTKIKLNHSKDSENIINKWKICNVDYGMNIGTEINWIRPSVVFKNSNYKYWEDIIVIPMTSYKEDQEWVKSVWEFDVKVNMSDINGLSNNSLIKVRQMRCVSKKRFRLHKKTKNIMILWEIDECYRAEIEWKMKVMLWI